MRRRAREAHRRIEVEEGRIPDHERRQSCAVERGQRAPQTNEPFFRAHLQWPRATFADFYVSEGGTGPLKVSPEEWFVGLRRTLSALDSAGLPTLVIRDAPLLDFDAPVCLARAAAHPRQTSSCS